MKRTLFVSRPNLLLSEANNDPVRKADLIRDVGKIIAVIPETITRTVYIKECSTLLEYRNRFYIMKLISCVSRRASRTGTGILLRKISRFSSCDCQASQAGTCHPVR